MVFHYQAGAEFGDYVLERRLGGGGFGDVWLAHGASGQQVALKLLTGRYSSDEAVQLRAEVELLAASASAGSQHIVRVLGGGLEPSPYVVMEYVDGTDLAAEIESAGRLPVSLVLTVARGVLEALTVLEKAGIIHRDVKPANVMLDTAGVVKLTDFGIAKIVGFDTITATNQAPLSMAYAAPEVWEGHATHQSDLYACGSMLYQCLAGRPAFIGGHAEVFRHHLVTRPDPALLPSDSPTSLRELILQCMAKAPEDRPADATAALRLVDQAEAEMSARMPPSSAGSADRTPKAFGPWQVISQHPVQPWAFICINRNTGEKATVEINFSDNLEYGVRLRRAVRANPKLVPLGAERLIGTNRLILRPDEAWAEATPANFQFWVARVELSASAPPATVSDGERRMISSALDSLIETAAKEDVGLNLGSENLSLLPGGRIHLRRPGLPSFVETDVAMDASMFLSSLPATIEKEATILVRPANQGSASPQAEALEAATMFHSQERAQRAAPPSPAIPPPSPLQPPLLQQEVSTGFGASRKFFGAPVLVALGVLLLLGLGAYFAIGGGGSKSGRAGGDASSDSRPSAGISSDVVTPRAETSIPAAPSPVPTAVRTAVVVGDLHSLTSYTYTVKLSGTGTAIQERQKEVGLGFIFPPGRVEYFGGWVAPDSWVITNPTGSMNFGFTVLGNRAWHKIGLTPATPDNSGLNAPTLNDSLVLRDLLASTDSNMRQLLMCSDVQEKVGDVNARKCSVSLADVPASLLPSIIPSYFDPTKVAAFTNDVWLIADFNYPIRLIQDVAGKDKAQADTSLHIEADLTFLNQNTSIPIPR